MSISVFDLFSIGIGPSSSHTVGPMRASKAYCQELNTRHLLTDVDRIKVTLYGSLAHTGIGHGTWPALLIGLTGATPETVEPSEITQFYERLQQNKTLQLDNSRSIMFDLNTDCQSDKQHLFEKHSNAISYEALTQSQQCLLKKVYYSIGGGFIVDDDASETTTEDQSHFPYPYANAKELLLHCQSQNSSIADIIRANEKTLRSEQEIALRLKRIEDVMVSCIDNGCQSSELVLPGGLNVPRRAPKLYQKLMQKGKPLSHELSESMSWLNLYALAVNEENAAGKRVVTAPTNGAAGIIPAVLNFYKQFYPNVTQRSCEDFLLTAGAIGILYKKGASISGAEVGCQGEVGSASSMAAAAITAVLGGTPQQVEQAAEIAMEHHLGMTCDPVGGLVQIPCIERNAMGAVKAVNAARLALLEDGQHQVSLDKVIKTMKQTGKDMMTIYKETSLGGLAVNVTEC